MCVRLFFPQVARAWSGKPPKITSIPPTPTGVPVDMKYNEASGSAKEPVTCFKTVEAACSAKWLKRPLKDGAPMRRGTTRMLCLFQVGDPGEGTTSYATNASGMLTCTRVVPLMVAPLPEKVAADCQPSSGFWVPGNTGGAHALD